MKKCDVLVHERDRVGNERSCDLAPRPAVQQHLAFPGLIQTADELHDRGLTAAGCAHQADSLPGLDPQTEVRHQGFCQAVIAEYQVAQFNLARELGKRTVNRCGHAVPIHMCVRRTIHDIVEPAEGSA